MSHFRHDLQFALRGVAHHRGLASIVFLTMALGIGANTSIYSVVYGVVLRPLPYPDPERLVVLHGRHATEPGGPTSVAYEDFKDWEVSRPPSFSGLGAAAYWTFNLTGREVPNRILGARVSGEFFSVMGSRPLLGRVLGPADDIAGRENVVVLGHGVWQRVFGGDPAIVGATIRLNGLATTVVGVMDRRFRFPAEEIELWAPLGGQLQGTPRNGRFILVVGRLARQATPESAQAQMDALCSRLEQLHPETNRGWGVLIVSAHETLVGNVRAPFLILLAGVGLVLLVACANVANLLLSHALSRHREYAIRRALGASWGRIVSQFLAEGLVFSAVGGTLGALLAWYSIPVIRALAPADVPRLEEIQLDAQVLLITLTATIGIGVVCGLLPALQIVRVGLEGAPEGGRTVAGGTGRHARAGLVVMEAALAVVLLVGAGLLLKSFSRLLAVEPGFAPDRVLTMDVFLTPPRYGTVEAQKRFIEQALDRLRTVPGVESVAASTQRPLAQTSTNQELFVLGRSETDVTAVNYRAVSEDYFRLMGIQVLSGRAFTLSDTDQTAPVCVVNGALAARLWPGSNPVGAQIVWRSSAGTGAPTTIVGIVSNVKTFGLDAPEEPAVYAPYTQRSLPFLRWTSVLVRTDLDPADAFPAIRNELSTIDPNQPVYNVDTMERLLSRSIAPRRFVMALLSLFALTALVLCIVGVYGLVSYSLVRRYREIGVRVALGAPPAHVFGMVIREGLALTGFGLALGMGGSLLLTDYLSSLLFEVAPRDLATFGTIGAVLLTAAISACLGPARRATRIDPIVALRSE